MIVSRQRTLVSLLMSLFLACSNNQSQNHSGVTEGGNATLTGKILDSLGCPVPYALMQLRRQSYLINLDTTVVDSLLLELPTHDTYTDESGLFHFRSVPFGNYFLESEITIYSSSKKNGWNSGTNPSKVLNSVVAIELQESDSLHIVDSIHVAGSISGTIEGYFIQDGYHFVKIQGLEHYTTVDTTTGNFALDHVPAGQFRLIFTGDEHSNGAFVDVTLGIGEKLNLGTVRFTRL